MASTIRPIGDSNEIDRILNRDFTSFIRTGYVEVGEDNVCLPIYYKDFSDRINDFEVKNDDVYVLAYPKTGSTWTQEMVWLIVNKLDYETARKIPVYERSKCLEAICLNDTKQMHNSINATEEIWEKLVNSPSPRIIKSHLPWSLLPEQLSNGIKTPKMIVTLRNPEDVCISFYHHSQSIGGYRGTFEDFCKLFLAGRVNYGPFWKHILSYWNERHRANILILYYSDMVDDLKGSIRKVADFLEKSMTDEEVLNLSKHLSFESMKNNPAVNFDDIKRYFKSMGMCVVEHDFLRVGKVGEHKLKLSPEQMETFKIWKEKNTESTGLVL